MVDNVDAYRRIEELTQASSVKVTQWKAPGPLSLQYLQTDKEVRVMIGPNGCGKTTTGMVDEVYSAIRAPMCEDGVRRWRVLFLRDTLRDLYRTTIKTWHRIFPENVGDWNGGQDRPAEHKLLFMDDFGPVEFEAVFAAIPDGGAEQFYDGFEPSSIFINGLSSVEEEIFTFGAGRIGRYPEKARLPKGFDIGAFIGGDMNKTDVDHWTYRYFVEEVDPAYMLVLDFPGGLAANAENRENLDSQYYERALRINRNRPWWGNIYVHNKWGASKSGAAVFNDEWDDQVHMSGELLVADPALDLCIGLDAGTATGGRPAAVFFQVAAPYRVNVLAELYLGRAGPNRFGDGLIAMLDHHTLRPARQRLRLWADPSCFYGGGEDEDDEETWLEVLERKLGLDIDEPESNELEGFRHETVRVLLNAREAGLPMFRLSPACPLLRKGFNSGYRYKMTQKKDGTKEAPKPEKNDVSHPHDALQHGVTGYFGKSLVMNGGRSQAYARKPPASGVLAISPDFDPFA